MKKIKLLSLCLLVFCLFVCAFAVMINAETVSSNVVEGVRIDYDTETKAMHIVNVNGTTTLDFAPITQGSDKTLQNFMNTYNSEVKSVEVDYFNRLNQFAKATFFYNFTALESVHFAANQYFRMRNNAGFNGMFEGCTSLKTVWVGDDSNKTVGVVNLVGARNVAQGDIFLERAFYGCSALEKVVLPTGTYFTTITSNTFAGCTSLKEVTIPANVTAIADDAFSTCTNVAIIAEEGTYAYEFAVAKDLLPKDEPEVPEEPEVPGSLWAEKPTTAPLYVGYLKDATGDTTSVETNIKYEVHNMGDNSYNLYLYIDETVTTGDYKDNKIITAARETIGKTKDHPFASAANNVGQLYIQAIAIGNGIEGIETDAFAFLKAVTVIELPESFTSISGSAFREMNALTTVYVRGTEYKENVIDLSNITNIDLSAGKTAGRVFMGLSAAKEYIFNPDVTVVDSNNGCNYMFYNNSSLKSLDLSMMSLTALGTYAFQGCTALEEIKLPASVTKMTESGDDATFLSNTALKAIYAPIGSFMHGYALENGYNTTNTAEISNATTTYASFTFYPESGRVEFASIASTDFYGTHGAKNYLAVYGDLVEEIVFVNNFPKIRPEGMFENLTKLRSVCFGSAQRIYEKTGNIFKNCSSLTTVYFGDEDDMVMEIADFSGMNLFASSTSSSDRPGKFMEGLFMNCSSVKNVILPSTTAQDTNYPYAISATTFSGCDSLRSITVAAEIVSIADSAFESCTALTEIIMNAPVSLIGENTFAGGTKGLVIYFENASDADIVNEILEGKDIPTSSAFAFSGRGMKIEGYQVRTDDYNGLRAIFSFDETAKDGYTLVEYGSIISTVKNWENYSASYGNEDSILKLENGEFVTPIEKIKKTAIYKNGEYFGNHTKTEKGSEFKFTVVKFSSETQYKSELVHGGYEIWEKDGEYYTIFTNEDSYGLSALSLYKVTLQLLINDVIELKKDASNPIWNVLNECTKTEIATDNDAVSAFLLADPINEGKFIAVYVTDSSEDEEIKSLGVFGKDRSRISASIFGTGVIYSLPILDIYWSDHIDEKLAALPEGDSFIVYTDTHYQLGANMNTEKAPDLIQYIRANTGIKTVINLGDPYSKEDTIDKAEEIFREAVEEDFYDRFGEDALYVVGNHEANKTRWSKLVSSEGKQEGVDGWGAYCVLVPDSVISDATIKHIENKDGIVFDTEMLALADELTFSPIGDENSATGVYYTADEVKDEFIAWARQHYYYDDEENGIRYIAFNSGNCGVIESYVFEKAYQKIVPSQMRFVAEALTDIPTDENGKSYNVVFLAHMLGSNTANGDDYSALFQLLSAFKAGRSYTYKFTKTGNAAWDAVVGIDGEMTFDFTGNNFTGVIFTLSGHWHGDLSFVYQTVGDKYQCNVPYAANDNVASDAVFYIGLNNDSLQPVDPGIENDLVMTAGTNSENCISIITVTESGEIVLTRIGAGHDRSFIYKK